MIHIPNRKRGVSLTGYGLIVGLISIVALGAVTQTGSQVDELFCRTADAMAGAEGSCSGGTGNAKAAAPDTEPDAFAMLPSTYTESSGVVVSTEPTQINGIDADAPLTFSRSSLGNGEFRICGDSSCSSVLVNWGDDDSGVTVSNGQYVQTRLTTGSGTRTATVNIGGVEATQTYQYGEGNVIFQHSSGQYYGIYKINFSYRIVQYSDVQSACSSYGRQAPDDAVSSGADMTHFAGFNGWPGDTIYCYQDALNAAGNYTACRPFLITPHVGSGPMTLQYIDNQTFASQSNYLFCKIDPPV